MIVKVENAFNGHKCYQRLILPDGGRFNIYHETWTREAAKEALDIIEAERPKVRRRSVRFKHR